MKVFLAIKSMHIQFWPQNLNILTFCLRCAAIGVHLFNIRSTWNCGMACELSARKSIFAICDCDAHRGPQKSQRFPR